jgi:hypothetical protein
MKYGVKEDEVSSMKYGVKEDEVSSMKYGVKEDEVSSMHYGVKEDEVSSMHYGVKEDEVSSMHYGVKEDEVSSMHYGVKQEGKKRHSVYSLQGERRLQARPELQELRHPRAALLRQALDAYSTKGASLPTVDVVVSRYDEDPSWLHEVERQLPTVRIFVYEKGAKAGVKSACDMLSARVTCTPLMNVGREAHTYLTHIVTRYDKLADKVVFVQGGAPGYGFGPGLAGGHLMPGSDLFYDYLSPTTPPRYVYTFAMANRADRDVILRRADFPVASEVDVSTIPAVSDELPESCGRKWLVQVNATGHFWTSLAREGKVSLDDPDAQDHVAFWKNYLEAELGPMPRGYTPFANGAVFSASSAQLRARSAVFYAGLLSALGHANFPASAIFLEFFWAKLLGLDRDFSACFDAIGKLA